MALCRYIYVVCFLWTLVTQNLWASCSLFIAPFCVVDVIKEKNLFPHMLPGICSHALLRKIRDYAI